jgi:hypothetical protein
MNQEYFTIRDTLYEVSKFLNIAKKDIWNANRIRDKYVSDIPIEDNQILLFESFSNEYRFNDYTKNASEVTYGEYELGTDPDDELPTIYRTLNIVGNNSSNIVPYKVLLYPNNTPEKGIEHVIFNSTNNEIQIEYMNGVPSFDIIISENEGTRLLYIGSNNVSWTTL